MTAHAANVDLKDFLPSSPGQVTEHPLPMLFINGPNGKQYYKGSIVTPTYGVAIVLRRFLLRGRFVRGVLPGVSS